MTINEILYYFWKYFLFGFVYEYFKKLNNPKVDLKQFTYLESKKRRNKGREFYIVMRKGDACVKKRISFKEFKAHKLIGKIPVKGTEQYFDRVNQIEI